MAKVGWRMHAGAQRERRRQSERAKRISMYLAANVRSRRQGGHRSGSRGSPILTQTRTSETTASGRYGLLPTSRSLEFGDLILLPGQLPAGEQAAAIPPGFTLSRAQEHSGIPALKVGFVVAYVSARCREIKFTRRPGASIPGLVAVLETCLATIGAIAGGFLKRGKLRHCRTLCGRRRLSGWRCRARCSCVCHLRRPLWRPCRLLRPLWPCHLLRRVDCDAGKRGSAACCGLRHCGLAQAAQQCS
jgi:hypothetical protein